MAKTVANSLDTPIGIREEWGVPARVPTGLDVTVIGPSGRMNATLLEGSEEFKAVQLSERLDSRFPPSSKQKSRRNVDTGPEIRSRLSPLKIWDSQSG
jgi:hypothetical protein